MEIILSPGDAKPHLIKLLRACMAGGMNAYEALNVLQTALDDVKANPGKYLSQAPRTLPPAYAEELTRVFGACGEDGDLGERGPCAP
jgi:hypothetical protein